MLRGGGGPGGALRGRAARGGGILVSGVSLFCRHKMPFFVVNLCEGTSFLIPGRFELAGGVY